MNNFGYDNSWSGKFGNNFTEQPGIHQDMMARKNYETAGGYQAEVSGMYGEFNIASVFKALPEEYIVLNDILIQTGIKYRHYGLKEMQLFGEPNWELAIRRSNQYVKISDEDGIRAVKSGNNSIFEMVKQSSQLDHVIVSPYGIFVIETKNHKGSIYGDINGKVWTQVVKGESGERAYGGYSRFTFYNPVLQNEQHMNYLSKYLGLGRQFMVGMIVFTNPDARLINVDCNFCFTVDMLAEAILSFNDRIWSNEQTERVIHAIEKIDSSNYSLSKEHIKYVKDLQYRKEVYKAIKGRR